MKKKPLTLIAGLFATALSVLSAHSTLAQEVGPGFVNVKNEGTVESELEEELWYDELSLLAQIVEAEAGNQDLTGKRLVVDVVLNRVDSPRFPNTITEVIYQRRQFSCLKDGNFERAGNYISEESFEAVRQEVFGESRIDYGIVFFSGKPVNGKNHWKYQDHWFSY